MVQSCNEARAMMLASMAEREQLRAVYDTKIQRKIYSAKAYRAKQFFKHVIMGIVGLGY